MNLNLADLCLDIIADNFSKYYLVYKKTTDENAKQKFEFLQKEHSVKLIARLTTKHGFPEEYIDFLINKYLNVLDTIWFINCSKKTIISKLGEIGLSLENIFQLKGSLISGLQWQEILHYLPNLKSFTCNVRCHDLILKDIALSCPNIEEIDVRDTRIDNTAVKHLTEIESGKPFYANLKKLFIKNTYINDEGVLCILKYAPCVELDYEWLPQLLYELNKNDSLSFKMNPCNITALDMRCVDYSSFADVVDVCLSLCPNLKSFGYNIGCENDVTNFPKLPNLEHLCVFCENWEINIDNIFKYTGEKLISLVLYRCIISVSVIARCCPLIEKITFSDVNFSDEDVNYKIEFKLLSSITFQSFNIFKNINIIELLFTFSNLDSISFRKCNLLSSEIKDYIIKCCKLHPVSYISFFCSDIETEFVKFILSTCKTLRFLNLEACFPKMIEDELIKFVATLKHKPVLYINENSDNFHYKDYLNKIYESKKYEFPEYVTDSEEVLIRNIVISCSSRFN